MNAAHKTSIGKAVPGSSRQLAMPLNVVIAGLGGQGVITASDILSQAAFRAGFEVKKSEIHGMSQRGGSVTSDIRFGPQVLSPMVPPGEADFLLVLAADQVEVNRNRLKAGGMLIGPEQTGLANLSNRKSLNVALLGVLSAHLELPETKWIEAIHVCLPQKLHAANEQAFEAGRQAAISEPLEISSGKA
jgi:indolepyruvate ferredoxin oxidoreductase beta subunit